MSDVIAEFPLCDGGKWLLTTDTFRQLRAAYGDTRSPSWVRAELQKAQLWLVANPRRQKKPAGMMRFVVGWLNRASVEHKAPMAVIRNGSPVSIQELLGRARLGAVGQGQAER